MRIVLDTNVIISAIRSARGASFVLLDLAGEHNGFFELVLTEALASEYEDVIYRPEHRMNWTDDELYGLIQSLLVPAHWTATNFTYRPLLDDAGDELVLAAAINGQAKYIVTFNVRHFAPATVATYGVQVVRPGDFLKILVERGLFMEKSNFALRLLPSLHKAAQRIAERENCSVNQLINVALAEKIAILDADYWGERKKAAAKMAKPDVLRRRAGNTPPREGDELPEAMARERSTRRKSVTAGGH